MKIPFSRPSVGEEEIRLITETLRSGWITQGPRVVEFERQFAAYTGAQYAVAVSSCTAALHLALKSLEIGPGDEVLCPAHSFIATANAIRYCGAQPIFVDIDGESLNIDPVRAEEAMTPNTKALLAVHQIGRPADLEELAKIAQRAGIALVEDAACAAGSSYRNEKIGGNRYSSAVCFSFHPRKILSTGDGGMLTTDREDLAQQWRLLRQHGMSINDLQRDKSHRVIAEEYLILGYNYRMTDVQAAIGLPQLTRLDAIVKERRHLAQIYDEALTPVPGIHVFHEPDHSFWNYQTYLVRLENASLQMRDGVMQELLDKGIATRRGIMSIHREPCYLQTGACASLPFTEQASDQCICLPLYPGMSEREVHLVVTCLRDAVYRRTWVG